MRRDVYHSYPDVAFASLSRTPTVAGRTRTRSQGGVHGSASAPTPHRNVSRVYTAVSRPPSTNQPSMLIIDDGHEDRRVVFRRVQLALIYSSAVLLFVGWWFLIDATIIYGHVMTGHSLYYGPGVASTMAFLLVNIITDDYLADEYCENNVRKGRVAKTVFFVGWLLAFTGLLGATYLLVYDYVGEKTNTWPAWAVIIQNVVIFIATVLHRVMLLRRWRALRAIEIANL